MTPDLPGSVAANVGRANIANSRRHSLSTTLDTACASRVAPLLKPVLQNDAEFIATVAMPLRNVPGVNMIDGWERLLPCRIAGEMPVGSMIWSTASCNDSVLGACFATQAAAA